MKYFTIFLTILILIGCSEDSHPYGPQSKQELDELMKKLENSLDIDVLFHGKDGKEIQFFFDLSLFERDGVFLKCSNPRASESEIGPIKVKSLVLKENGEYEWIDSSTIIFLTNKEEGSFTSMFVIQTANEKTLSGDPIYIEMYEGVMRDRRDAYYIYFTEEGTWNGNLNHFINLKRDDLSIEWNSYFDTDEYDRQGKKGRNGYGNCNIVEIDPISQLTELFDNRKKAVEARRLESEAKEKAKRESNKI
mgnify:CR=1 FL=1